MKSCSTRKRMYLTESLAEEALIGAHTAFEYQGNTGPVAVYRCDDCGNFHLTSSGPMNPRLAKHLADGHVKRDKEANHWANKLKRK